MTTRIFALLAGLALVLSACGGADAQAEGEGGAGDDPTSAAPLGQSGVPTLSSADGDAEDSGRGGDPGTEQSDGDPDDDGADTAALDENSSDDEIFALWQPCMIEEGIDDLVGLTVTDLASLETRQADADYVAAARVCDALIVDAFGSFELDAAMEAELADRSVQLAACGRDILDVDIPDDVLFLAEDDQRMVALDNLETTPEQDEAIEACLQEALGDLFDEDGNFSPTTDEGEGQ